MLHFEASSDIFRNFDEYGLIRPEIIRMDVAAWVSLINAYHVDIFFCLIDTFSEKKGN